MPPTRTGIWSGRSRARQVERVAAWERTCPKVHIVPFPLPNAGLGPLCILGEEPPAAKPRVATSPRTVARIERELVERVPQADRAQGKVGRLALRLVTIFVTLRRTSPIRPELRRTGWRGIEPGFQLRPKPQSSVALTFVGSALARFSNR